MRNIQKFMSGQPLNHQLPVVALTLEQVKEQPNPLSLLTEFPYESQWLDKEAWNWLELALAHAQVSRYAETGDLKAFTRQTAFNIANEN